MRKKILEKKLARLQAKKTDLVARCQASADVNEVRSLTAQMEDVNAEIEETQAELDAIEAEEARSNRPDAADYFSTPAPANAVPVNGQVRASAQMATAETRNENKSVTKQALFCNKFLF